jgi:hypothetical protein
MKEGNRRSYSALRSLGASLFGATLVAGTLIVAPLAAADSCSDLANLALPNTTITTAQSVTGGSFTPPGSTTPITGLPDFCRVAAYSAPTSDSHIQFEVWIPESHWNDKYLQAGCGGFCGSISYSSMAGALMRGYAAAATDDGHEASGIDASWAVGHPQKVVDFAYRSLKVTTDNAKAIITAYESGAPTRSYFDGCSDGGREALMEAQRYPGDFDGIIAGSPANAWTQLFTGFVWNELALTKTPDSALTQSDLDVLSNAVLAKCAGHDGGLASDQFLNNPPACKFNPESVKCKDGASSSCLSQAKVTAVKKIYSGPPAIFPGYRAGEGSENVASNWPAWLTDAGDPTKGLQELFGNSFFADIVFPNTGWTPTSTSINQDIRAANATASVINSDDPDLRDFVGHGGKLIQYVGWADTAISPQNDINYYESVEHVLGGPAKTGKSYRLFMVPGMSHCAGGSGANAFGNSFRNGPDPADPSDDVVSALDQWVELGVAPDRIIATKYVSDNPANGIAFQRPLCPYPEIAQYAGGDPTLPNNWVCAQPKGTGHH